jgi:two-component system chemotaxis response regulator CheY
VLIVDDAAFMRAWLRGILEAEGFEIVGEAEDGEKAVAAFAELRPDVMTMDLMMPRRSGVDAVREIMQIDSDARIVICSAQGLEAVVMEALQAGARDYFVKPLRPCCVVSTLRSVLGKGR